VSGVGEVVLAESVGLALLVVLDSLAPAERLAFVLHDVFAVPFAEVAAVLDRSEAAAQQIDALLDPERLARLDLEIPGTNGAPRHNGERPATPDAPG
jgi:Sigma-70, region 4